MTGQVHQIESFQAVHYLEELVRQQASNSKRPQFEVSLPPKISYGHQSKSSSKNESNCKQETTLSDDLVILAYQAKAAQKPFDDVLDAYEINQSHPHFEASPVRAEETSPYGLNHYKNYVENLRPQLTASYQAMDFRV